MTGPEGNGAQVIPAMRTMMAVRGNPYFGHDPGSGFTVYDPPSANGYDIPPSFTRWATGEPNDWVNSGGG